MSNVNCVVVLLTFNSESIIRETVKQALKVSGNIFAVDSNSNDATVNVLKELGVQVVNRNFVNYSDQRNWAISELADKFAWQLHLDADEVLDEEAIESINSVLTSESSSVSAFMIRRRDYFMGKMLRFSGVNPWHLRLFRSGSGQCESRLYDQHFITSAPVLKLRGYMHDKNSVSLSDWTVRHNRWSDAEAKEALSTHGDSSAVLRAKFFGDARERIRFLKNVYYRLPAGFRFVSYFFYRYFFRLGFLDGTIGFYFSFFQAFWFRALVDAKIFEIKNSVK